MTRKKEKPIPIWAVYDETARRFDSIEELMRFAVGIRPITPLKLPLFFGYIAPPGTEPDGYLKYDPAWFEWTLKIATTEDR